MSHYTNSIEDIEGITCERGIVNEPGGRPAGSSDFQMLYIVATDIVVTDIDVSAKAEA